MHRCVFSITSGHDMWDTAGYDFRLTGGLRNLYLPLRGKENNNPGHRSYKAEMRERKQQRIYLTPVRNLKSKIPHITFNHCILSPLPINKAFHKGTFVRKCWKV